MSKESLAFYENRKPLYFHEGRGALWRLKLSCVVKSFKWQTEELLNSHEGF